MLTYSTECGHWKDKQYTHTTCRVTEEWDVISEVFNSMLFIVNILVGALQLKKAKTTLFLAR